MHAFTHTTVIIYTINAYNYLDIYIAVLLFSACSILAMLLITIANYSCVMAIADDPD